MKELLQAVILVLMITGFMGLLYKIYLQNVIKDPSRKGKHLHVVFRLFFITDLLPLRIKYKTGEELALRKRANKALAIFYINFFITALLIAFFL
jgi:hypothetical protein